MQRPVNPATDDVLKPVVRKARVWGSVLRRIIKIPTARSMSAREAIPRRRALAACSSRWSVAMASSPAPRYSAMTTTRSRSRSVSATAECEYRFSDPTGTSALNSGIARKPSNPALRAAMPRVGHRVPNCLTDIRTDRPVRDADRQGPSPRRYCVRSNSSTRSSVGARVNGSLSRDAVTPA